jgi:hypothetical protein
MTKPGKSVAPTQEGLPIAKDVWMLGIGIGLLTRGLLDRQARKAGPVRKNKKAVKKAAKLSAASAAIAKAREAVAG